MLLFLLTLSEESNHSKIERLYNSYHDDMMKFARIKLRDMRRKNYIYDAEDAVQNAFVKITKSIENIDFSRDEKELRGYVFSVLMNEILKILREKEIFSENFEENLSENGYYFIEQLEITEKYNEVVEAIKNMDEKYSTTLFFAFCEEMSVRDIAKMMGISEKTVYSRLARGKSLLLCSLKGVVSNGQ